MTRIVDREVFVDTSAWVALADKADERHNSAGTAFYVVFHRWQFLVTTNLVIGESFNLIRQRLGVGAGLTFLDLLQRSPRLIRVQSDINAELHAADWLRRHPEQNISFVDAVSFAVMRERGVTHAFAFDPNFAAAGFSLIPTG